MNLSQDVLRLLTVKALRGRTWAGQRVFDSPAEPADLRIEEERAAFIAVYTDDADWDFAGAEGGGLDWNGGGEVNLILEVGVASQIEVEQPATPVDLDPTDPDMDTAPAPATRVELEETDEALELQIGFIARQAVMALKHPSNPWAELWRQMVMSGGGLQLVQVRRGGSGQTKEEEGPRYASRVVLLKVGVVGEPVWGEGVPADPRAFWNRLLTAFAADSELSGVGDVIRSHFEFPSGAHFSDWRRDQAALGITDLAARRMGFGPVRDDMEDVPEAIERIELTADGGAFPVEFDATTTGPIDASLISIQSASAPVTSGGVALVARTELLPRQVGMPPDRNATTIDSLVSDGEDVVEKVWPFDPLSVPPVKVYTTRFIE